MKTWCTVYGIGKQQILQGFERRLRKRACVCAFIDVQCIHKGQTVINKCLHFLTNRNVSVLSSSYYGS